MNTMMIQSLRSAQQEATIQLLAERHYEQVYGFFNAFFDNPALCLELTDHSFRDAELSGMSTVGVFTQAVARLKGRPGFAVPVETSSFESNIAWMLKEIAGLSYLQISHTLGISSQDVKERIAGIRMSVMTQLAA